MSKSKDITWSADGTTIPSIQAHTKVKHCVLEEYTQAWIETLAGHGVHGVRTVTLIDGFCGGGIYQDGLTRWEGSPLRMIKSLKMGLQNVQLRKPYHQTDFEFIFIDERKDHTECLKLQLMTSGYEQDIHSGKIKVITGKFQDYLDFCINKVKERGGYSIFFLDPYGLDTTPEIVRRIMAIGRSEILLNHMLSGLVRLLKQREDRYIDFFKKFDAEDYYQEYVDLNDKFQKQAYLRNEICKLYRDVGGAKYIHTFALMKNRYTVYYYLIHLSSNPTALSVMRDITWLTNNLSFQFHYDVYGVGFRNFEEISMTDSLFNIEMSNEDYCLEKLIQQIADDPTGRDQETFKKLFNSTLQENPATKDLYKKAFNIMRDDGDIVIVRNGKITSSKRIGNKDIIRRVGKQFTFFNTNDYRIDDIGVKKKLVHNSKKSSITSGSQQLTFDLLD